MMCRAAFAEIAVEVNAHGAAPGQVPKSLDEIAMGFIRVANETMCRPIRALTQMRVRKQPQPRFYVVNVVLRSVGFLGDIIKYLMMLFVIIDSTRRKYISVSSMFDNV